MKAIAFSGGKDSLACWFLTRADEPLVIWVNTGKAYPETISVINMVKNQSKHFLEIKTDQENQNMLYGLPSDIVPVDLTPIGSLFSGGKPKVQSYLDCCYSNLCYPLIDAAKKNGVTELIYGQRKEDSKKGNAIDGQIVDGIIRRHPIENWTKDDVTLYLKKHLNELPKHFDLNHSSMDCYDCTAYLADNNDRLLWTKKYHPNLYGKFKQRFYQLKKDLNPSVSSFMNMDV